MKIREPIIYQNNQHGVPVMLSLKTLFNVSGECEDEVFQLMGPSVVNLLLSNIINFTCYFHF